MFGSPFWVGILGGWWGVGFGCGWVGLFRGWGVAGVFSGGRVVGVAVGIGGWFFLVLGFWVGAGWVRRICFGVWVVPGRCLAGRRMVVGGGDFEMRGVWGVGLVVWSIVGGGVFRRS